MKRVRIIAIVTLVCCLLATGNVFSQTSGSDQQKSAQKKEQKKQYPNLPSETPDSLTPTNDGFDHIRREVMIPMRDGVRLHTVILVPKGAAGAPILLTRTPYNATDLTSHSNSAHLDSILWGYDNATEVIVEGGYIRVVQDIRG